ncbi:MAG: class B sortase [Clostridia bacterium]|nr:class B sortase [Clostridia bacterium]
MIITDRKKLLNRILLIAAVIVFTVSLILLIINLIPDNEDYSDFKNSSDIEVELPDNPIDFAALKERNPDVIGWITVKDTDIDYPILQSGTDKAEDYYLKRDIDENWKKAGSIYTQRLNNDAFLDPNTVLYGHHLADKTMFTPLWDFRDKQTFEEHDTVYIYTPGHILTYKIFSAFKYDDRHILNSFDFSTKEGYGAFLEDCLNPKSLVKNVREGVSVTTDDRIITLSTCTNYAYYSDERYLVVAVLTDDTKTK